MKKIILSFIAFFIITFTVFPQNDVMTVADFDNELPNGWSFVSESRSVNHISWHSSGALYLTADNVALYSPSVHSASDVKVDLIISGLIPNKKSTKSDTIFIVYALNRDSAVVDVKFITANTLKSAGHYSVKLSSTNSDIECIKVELNAFPRVNGAAQNIVLKSVRVSSVDRSSSATSNPNNVNVSVDADLLYTNIPDNEYYEIFSITGARLLKGYSYNNKINISELNKGIYIIRTSYGASKFIVK